MNRVIKYLTATRQVNDVFYRWRIYIESNSINSTCVSRQTTFWNSEHGNLSGISKLNILQSIRGRNET